MVGAAAGTAILVGAADTVVLPDALSATTGAVAGGAAAAAVINRFLGAGGSGFEGNAIDVPTAAGAVLAGVAVDDMESCLSRLLTRSSNLSRNLCSCISWRLMSVTVPVWKDSSSLDRLVVTTVVEVGVLLVSMGSLLLPLLTDGLTRFFFI